ncbi:TPA: hypothetical protein ACPP6E_000575 [Haemophilus influenzae]|uniref:hypothetical protein n=1 Tax=Haemophilus influenzae TaxID=727 RepID=UPI000D7881A5|nr:hypothetical protein [Haemophilus influenzae]AYO33147.1 hypothetical protein CH617_04360 [Haemophilus influenzae]MCK9097643.1 hypothetical protein [Haemophilus influenzae]MCK9111649.1 hypothetical protein [Haemophilus influenzae]MCK9121799.1 hypothetical protein [Haemophilus influenzae]MCK9675090.1 hypothetical protein [Haemophilus influenzae]
MEIKSLENLLDLAEKLLKGDDINEIDFSEFAKISVKIDGDNYDGALTASLCQSLNQFHDSLSRLYCIAKYGEENLNKLSDEDKSLLNVTFQVNAGCTEWNVDLQELFKNIGKQVVDKMNPLGLSICVGLGIVGVTGYQVYDRYAEMTEKIVTQTTLTESIKEQAIAMKEMAKSVSYRAQDLYIEQLKTYDNPKEITLSIGHNSTKLDQDEIQELTKRTRRKIDNAEKTIQVRIESIKKSADKYIVSCSLWTGGNIFLVNVDTSFIDKEETDLLFDAFRDNKPVNILGNIKSYQGEIQKVNASSISIDKK